MKIKFRIYGIFNNIYSYNINGKQDRFFGHNVFISILHANMSIISSNFQQANYTLRVFLLCFLSGALVLSACRSNNDHKPTNGNESTVEAVNEKATKAICHEIESGILTRETLDSLVKAGADLNCSCSISQSKRRMGAKLPVVRDLMKRKTKRVKAAFTPACYAVVKNDTNMISYIFENGGDKNSGPECNPLLVALESDNYVMVQLLSEYGVSLKRAAIPFSFIESDYRSYLEHGGNLNNADPTTGDAPLHRAAFFNKPDLAAYLIKEGARVDLQNQDGDTPLHITARIGAQELCLKLLKEKPDLLIKNKKDETVLYSSIYDTSGKSFKLIADYYLSTNQPVDWKSISSFARQLKNDQVMRSIRSYQN